MIIVILMGLTIGSFLNVIATRPITNLDNKRSQCPTCKTILQPIDLIPVISWIILKGKCRYCNTKISFLYPISEITNTIAYVLIYMMFNTKGIPLMILWSGIQIIIINKITEECKNE